MTSRNPGIEVSLAIYRHYSVVIKTMWHCISEQTALDVSRSRRLLLTPMILSSFEVIPSILGAMSTKGSLLEFLDDMRG